MANEGQAEQIELNFEPIRGYPELKWAGKRPFRSTYYYPAQLKERHGEPREDGWRNRLYWGDNLQVMSHLLREFRGQVKLIYIDPPYDSKADYKKRIELRGQKIENDRTGFEEKQYSDIWTNDEYLQFMYERLVVMWELLAPGGSLFLHCDWHADAALRLMLDELFGRANFKNAIAWCYTGPSATETFFPRKHDTILFYTKSGAQPDFNLPRIAHKSGIHNTGQLFGATVDNGAGKKDDLEADGKKLEDWWIDIWSTDRYRSEMLGYPTQKPQALIERIIQASSNPGDLVFDAFMGSGTTQAVAMKLGRRFLGCDINLGAIHTTVSRLNDIAKDIAKPKPQLLGESAQPAPYTAFEVYTVNNYDVFRNEVEAKPLLLDALGVSPTAYAPWDGTRDGRMVKIMPINRIATRAELNEILATVDPRRWDAKAKAAPNEPVERITLICMGHEPDLGAHLEGELRKLCNAKFDIEVVDVLRSGANLQFKRESDAKVSVDGTKLSIDAFYPMNLLQKLSLDAQQVGDWKELVDSVMIDWNYDGAVFTPTEVDVPEGKSAKVKGTYTVPADAGAIRVKITDVLSESWEKTVWGAE